MPRRLLVVVLVFFHDNLVEFGAQGTSLDREGPGDLAVLGLVRRETQKVNYFQSGVHLGRVGEIAAQKRVGRSQRNDRDASTDITICNDNFVVGLTDGSGKCQPGHTHIITEQMCEKAAAAVKAPLGTPWPTPRAQDPIAGNINTHPKGCYSKTVSGEVTYHYNGISDEIPTPHIEDGEAAVCRRDKLKFGTVDTNNCNSSEYKVLFNEDMCAQAARCLRYMHDGSMEMDFDVNVMDIANHDIFPAGCFVHPTEKPREVYYNPEKQGEATLTLPTGPKGTIICIAESVDINPSPAPNATEESNATGL